MAKKIKNNVSLGIFVVVSIVLFTAGVYYIGSRQNIFASDYKVSSLFHNVGGLRSGNNVRYAGINVGSVADIVFVNDSTLRVEMSLDEKVKGVIKKDAVASIGSDGLVGNVIVNIKPGKGSQIPVENGDIIASFSQKGTDDMLKTLDSTNDNIAILSLNLLEITKKLNEGNGPIPLLLRDSMMAQEISMALHNMRKTTENLRRMSEGLQSTVDQVNAGKGTLGQLLYDTTLVTELESLAVTLNNYADEGFKPIMEDLQHSGENLAESSGELKEALEKLNQGDGLANTLLRDTTAANDLKAILDNLNEGSLRFSENMEALKHNFFFRRYFKKQEKKKVKQKSDAMN